MNKTFFESMEHRRSYYALKNESPIGDSEIKQIVETAVKYTPSAFNSQSSRVVVLLGDKHLRLWQIVKDTLRTVVPADAFAATENKINACFESGYGTILFYEDQSTVKGLQEQFPLYADNFPVWSEQAHGITLFAVWTALENAGLGASVQHYNPLIDEAVAKEFNINANWKLRAQLPFGTPAANPEPKTFMPIEERVIVL